MGGRTDSKVKAKCPDCGKVMKTIIYKGQGFGVPQDVRERLEKRLKEQGYTNHSFPAHPPGARHYCEGAFKPVHKDQIIEGTV